MLARQNQTVPVGPGAGRVNWWSAKQFGSSQGQERVSVRTFPVNEGLVESCHVTVVFSARPS